MTTVAIKNEAKVEGLLILKLSACMRCFYDFRDQNLARMITNDTDFGASLRQNAQS